jgi:predicted ATPase
MIKTPDQRLRVFVSSTLGELAEERKAAAEAIGNMRLAPVLFELGARPHPPKDLYRAYLAQSHIFVGIYWERYGWVAPDMEMSGLEDEYQLAGSMPKLIYVKRPAPERESRLKELLETIKEDDNVSYKAFQDADELKTLIQDDLALLLTESFESRHPDAPTPVPESKHNLPSHPTPFVGRVVEAAALKSLLEQPEVRLVTITGPGGIGKTRLGLEVASRCVDSFRDGVKLVKLASVTDPRLILPEIARVLGTPDRVDGLSVPAVKEHIGDREMLLVLDNFEHLVIAAPVVGELLAGSPHLKVMVTSRSVLRLRGEYEYPTPTMQIPESRICRLEEVLQWESVRLFDERARAANPRFELTDENCDAVLEICRRRDGLPLALELAAARTKLLTPEAMLKRMDNRLQLLTSGSRDAPLRQRTLRDGLDWDYELLSAEEQLLFRGLAVFSGGFTFDSAEAVLNGNDQVWLDVFNGIDSLAGKSLIRRESLDSDDLRFGTLKIIREYALEKLTESEELEEFQRRHAEYFTGFAERCAGEIDGPVQSAWLVRLEAEHDNLRSALKWGHRNAPVLFTRLCAALGAFWEYRSYLTEGRYWLEIASEPRGTVPDELRASVLNYAGIMARAQGDYERGQARSEEAASLWRSLKNHERLANTLKNLGNIYLDTSDLGRASELYQESLDLYRAAGERHGAAATLNNLGVLARMRGEWDSAMSFYEEALTLFTEASDLQGRGRVLMNLGEARYEAGDYEGAARLCRDSLQLFRDTGSKWAIADVLEILGAIASGTDDAEEAAKLFGAAEALRAHLKTPLPPSEREVYERRILATRRKLDGSAFAMAWSWGRAMTLDEALDHALRSEATLR